ncbi:MAG: hypothetical protein A2249_01835 [Candidatus Jacksonbacteria bacterium RIFOXYA2_FULL_44_7]|uniref:ABC transmembrane type-2 domain-containing protein n=1 Tax=Candidatus Jacksonbacteria bacterium RIFCSPLOWO2_02_FULL_44_20 TaxID=1798460 RepID=A0A1G2A8H8_9BACT|nr:MAG: hypothetical protein A3E05_04685 [Candidatus Jacksonbacteria bacterium RIFCSPHIGHO2_12_FULL_44_12]OGY72877.1 MAG: hypothetical protein A3H07_02815 [Candidatus Jacksonbacteria bacterium RIFCSPLOWO2_12_FULL_44_15b]OGY73112.1 MAG: hypothetical protein A3H61_02795 [Candidatus Jacksonbacteria bacterium RIFCSPLOWO2_02_FULL_44_20]OGY76421.1 MAG: hypothetical protein A2249_01835 [Candidatus Jacksonbacteria bacterium RIFOXYA2_FULL_44_7]HCA67140.1 ABC transporter [Candidatus Jacksonbacteria bacte
MKLHRINAIILHYWYHSKRSLPRVMDVFYWPTMELILWGFVSQFLERTALNAPGVASFLLGGVILWGVFITSQHDVTIAFLEDIWSRNIINLFVSPLTVWEYLLGGIAVGVLKTFVIIGYISALAGLLYHFNLFTLGFSLIPFIANLFLFGIAAGIFISAIIFRYGTETQILAFSLGFLLQPISAVFYPLAILPSFLQFIAWSIPATHVFEGMRGVFAGSGFSALHFWWALVLNLVYLILASIFYARMFRRVRELGLLSKVE